MEKPASGSSLEAHYRAILDGAEDAIIVIDETGRVREFNCFAEALFGHPATEVIGRNVSMLMPEPHRSRHDGYLARYGKTGEARVIGKSRILEGQRRDGSLFPLELSVSEVATPGGRLFVSVIRDVTQRQRTLDRLQLERDNLRNILNAMDDGVYIVDADYDIQYVNPVIEREFGSVAGRKCFGYFHDRSESCPWCKNPEVMAGRSVNWEWYSPKTGHTYELFDTPIRNPDGTLSKLEFFHDITARKRAEGDLHRLIEDLAHSNQELQDFAHIVSHDLRSPIASIKGFSRLLAANLEEMAALAEAMLPAEPSERRKAFELMLRQNIPEAVGFIDAATAKMERLVEGILKLSRLGRREMELVPVEVRPIVEENMNALAYQLGEGRAMVSLGDLPSVIADRLALEQIFGNLLSNSVKYLDPGRPGRITVTAERGPEETVFAVSDNGRGIASHEIANIFKIFRRGGDTSIPGEGLGLAYVQALVRKLGGRVWCESTKGEGSVFRFSIPRTPPSRPALPTSRASPASG